MAKKEKKAAKPTPGKQAYAAACDAIAEKYEEYSSGEAEDEHFTTPGKQKKVAKQLAKIHNRMLKKIAEQNREELDEDPE